MPKKSKYIAQKTSSRFAEDADSMEGRIVELALNGKLAKAAGNAIRDQLAKGVAVTFKRGNQVIKQYPDGHEEVLAKVERPRYRIPRGVTIIQRKK